ncbi:hypothetical protein GCM10028805_33190 [Spirosoma harenae]
MSVEGNGGKEDTSGCHKLVLITISHKVATVLFRFQWIGYKPVKVADETVFTYFRLN